MKWTLPNTAAGLVMLVQHTTDAITIGVVDGSGDNDTALCKELLDVVQGGFFRQ